MEPLLVGRHGRRQCCEQMIGTYPIDPASPGQSGSQLAAQMGGGEDDAAVGQAAPELLESIGGGEVEVDIGLGVEHEPARRRLCVINGT